MKIFQAICRGLATLAFTAGASVAHAQPLPPLDVTLSPQASGGEATRLAVEMVLPEPALDEGEVFLRMPTTLVGVDTAAYDADEIEASDTSGSLKLTAVDEEPGSSGVFRRYIVDRATAGDVTVRYSTPPRPVSAETRNGPLFDLRAQGGGLLGAGVYFFALPESEQIYQINLDWDLSAMPEGSRGVWSLGEGEQTTEGPASLLRFSYYAAGPLQSHPESPDSDFHIYWLVEPPFAIDELADFTQTLYADMVRFFGAEDPSYRIFARRNPYPAGGGTALAQSFMFSYGADKDSSLRDLEMMLAHEMAHNWPELEGESHPLTAWYSEGTAEFYSLVLALRSGLISHDRFLDELNERASGYYTNPYIDLSNAEAGELFWSDSRAQRVPYGRGFMYLARVNAQILAATDGQRSLDDLVLEMLARQDRGDPAGIEDWIALVEAQIGPQAREDFEAMTAGELIVPPVNAFGPCYEPYKTEVRSFELGYDRMRLGVISDLVPGSNAAKAGLQEGDVIRSFTPLDELRDDPDRKMEMTIERNGERLSVGYLPRGEEVPAWLWRRVEDPSETQCGI